MTNPAKRRRPRSPGRRVWAYSQLNHDLLPEQLAKVIVVAGLEQARLETEAAAAAKLKTAPEADDA